MEGTAARAPIRVTALIGTSTKLPCCQMILKPAFSGDYSLIFSASKPSELFSSQSMASQNEISLGGSTVLQAGAFPAASCLTLSPKLSVAAPLG